MLINCPDQLYPRNASDRSMIKPSTQSFIQIMALPEAALNLAEAALLIALDEYPHLDVGEYLARIDDHASAVGQQGGRPEAMLDVLNQYLFEEQGFTGNQWEYEDPRNSFLNDVLDRKLGLPITLSVLYIEIGRRVGLPLEGVSFPGHFLVKLPVPGGEVMVDPFSQGITLTERDLERRLEALGSGPLLTRAIRAELLAAASKKAIIVRMLRNLKAVYFQRDEFEKALKVCERILTAVPDHPGELRDRGIIYQRLECYRAALGDLRKYLALKPDAADAENVRRQVIQLQNQAARLN